MPTDTQAPREDVQSPRPADLRSFIEYAPVAIVMLDAQMRYVAISRRWRSDFGLEGTDLHGRSHYEVFPEIPDHWKAVHRRCLAGAVEQNEAELFVRANGTRQWLRWAVQPWRTESGDIGGIIMFSEDITLRREAEASLQRAERAAHDSTNRLRMALEASGAAIWRWDVRANKLTWDERCYAMLGVAPDRPPIFDDWVACLHAEDRARMLARVDQILRTPGDDEWSEEFRVVHPDGTMLWLYGRGRVERDSAGAAIRFVGINLDITARRRAEAALEASQQQKRTAAEIARTLFQTTAQGIVSMSNEGVIVAANAALEAMFGWSRGELVGQPIERLVPESARRSHMAHRASYMADPRGRSMGRGMDLTGERKDGSTFPVEVRLNYVVTESARRVIAFVTDISARKRAEVALREQRDALAAHTRELERQADQLRRLASDLTLAEQHAREQLAKTLHDHLQQLLFSATLKLDRASRQEANGAVSALVTKASADISQAIAASRSLAVELFPPVFHENGLPGALSWLTGWMEEKYGLVVDLSVEPAANPDRKDIRVLVFESVRELLFNVVKHAKVNRAVVSLALTPDDRIRITVSDEGQGFDLAATTGRTRATDGRLGLFSIRERLTLLGGHLEVESSPGMGCRFTLSVPRLGMPMRVA